MMAPARASRARFSRWMSDNGVSRGTTTRGRRSFSLTSAARSVRLSARPFARAHECLTARAERASEARSVTPRALPDARGAEADSEVGWVVARVMGMPASHEVREVRVHPLDLRYLVEKFLHRRVLPRQRCEV